MVEVCTRDTLSRAHRAGRDSNGPGGEVGAVNRGRLLPTARKTGIPPSDLEILPGMTTDASGNRPLTGGARMSPSAAKVHSIGSILTVLSSVFFAISFLCTPVSYTHLTLPTKRIV